MYITTLFAVLFGNVTKYKLNDETFKIWFYLDTYTCNDLIFLRVVDGYIRKVFLKKTHVKTSNKNGLDVFDFD